MLKEGRKSPEQYCKFHVVSKHSHFRLQWYSRVWSVIIRATQTAQPDIAVFSSNWVLPNYQPRLFPVSIQQQTAYIFSKYQAFSPLSLKRTWGEGSLCLLGVLLVSLHVTARHNHTHGVSEDRTFLWQIFPTLESEVQQLLLLHKLSEKLVTNCVALQTTTLS